MQFLRSRSTKDKGLRGEGVRIKFVVDRTDVKMNDRWRRKREVGRKGCTLRENLGDLARAFDAVHKIIFFGLSRAVFEFCSVPCPSRGVATTVFLEQQTFNHSRGSGYVLDMYYNLSLL